SVVSSRYVLGSTGVPSGSVGSAGPRRPGVPRPLLACAPHGDGQSNASTSSASAGSPRIAGMRRRAGARGGAITQQFSAGMLGSVFRGEREGRLSYRPLGAAPLRGSCLVKMNLVTNGDCPRPSPALLLPCSLHVKTTFVMAIGFSLGKNLTWVHGRATVAG